MLNQAYVKDLKGKLHRITANKPILLDDPKTVWVVQSGCVALFAVTVRDGVIEGARRYLLSIAAGEALFGTAPSSSDRYRQILAVPIGETELVELDEDYLSELIAKADTRVAILVEDWLQQLGSVLSPIFMPPIQIKAEGNQRFSLTSGQTFQPESGPICWVNVHQGNVRWMGFQELTLTSAIAPFPLNDAMWLEADGAVQLSTETTNAFRNSETLLEGLSQLHTQLLRYIDLLEQQEVEEERQRLQEREHHNRQVTEEALEELATSLKTQKAAFYLGSTPLLAVAGAVGKAMGAKIRPPARSEDPRRVKNPLEAIVRASRLRMRQVLLRDNWWEKDCGPLVAYTREEERPLALLPISANRYEIFDPVERTRIPVDANVASTVSPVAYTFYRSLPDKTLNALILLKFALKGRGRDLLIILLSGVAATLLGMVTPQANAILIDNAIPDSDKGLLLQVGLALLVVAIAGALFRLTQGFAVLRVESVSDADTQAAVWDRLLNLPVSFFRHYTTGDLQSRVTSVSTIRRQLSGTTLITLLTSLFSLLYLGLLFYYSVNLAFIAVAIALVVFVFTTVSGALLVRKVLPMLELQGTIFGQIVQLINGVSKLRVAGAEERAFAFWSKSYSKQVRLDLSTQYIEDVVTIFNTVLPTLTSAVLFFFAAKLIADAKVSGGIGLSIGTFVAFNSAFGTFIKAATDLSNTATTTLNVVPQWKRAQPILETKPEVELSKADPGRLLGRVALERVIFRYRDDGPLTLDQVSICAEPGEFIALVGASGSGKSTIFRLLLGFEAPESGTVYYDGQDLSGLDVDAVRRQLGVVLQTSRITSASIFDNIASGAQMTMDEAWEAARMAGFAEDVAAMPMQMHTVISEGGGNVSGGQRQRLLIARALALKPRILLFDEATSALDNKTQAIVSESLDRLQVTRLVIAHRLSTIRNAHRIYVLEAGRVVQQGSFDELATQEGLFAQLIARQKT